MRPMILLDHKPEFFVWRIEQRGKIDLIFMKNPKAVLHPHHHTNFLLLVKGKVDLAIQLIFVNWLNERR